MCTPPCSLHPRSSSPLKQSTSPAKHTLPGYRRVFALKTVAFLHLQEPTSPYIVPSVLATVSTKRINQAYAEDFKP